MINLDELIATMEVQTNILNEKQAAKKRQSNNVIVMRTSDYNGFTCKAESCFDKAEFFGTNTYFCESHMLIKVGA